MNSQDLHLGEKHVDSEHGGRPSALEVATYAVTQLEDEALFNCAHGAVFTRDGINELEASVMVSRGFKKRGVGITGLRHVRNPILLARKMLEHGEEDLAAKRSAGGARIEGQPRDLDVPSAQGHTILHGKAAEQLARQYGLELVDPQYFFTQQRWDEHIRALEREKNGKGLSTWDINEYLPQGTTGAVALDEHGVICAATSTGGLTNKLTGRIGDTPVLGAGFWAEEWEEAGDPTSGSGSWYTNAYAALTNLELPVVLSGALHGFLADCLPTPFTYQPLRHNEHLYASSNATTTRSIGISGTGNGDSFLRTDAARTAAAMARWKPETAAAAFKHVAGPGGELQRSAGDRWRLTGEGEGGMIGIECAVVRDGSGRVVETRSEILQEYNCGGMWRAWIDDEGRAMMSVWS
jgi:L-asparaginase